jgi:NADPH-dependent 2,4-dienoyl-CoA reductase/sulfur reductase-like enzyme
LVIATGYRNQDYVIPGLDTANGAYTITTLEDAIHAGEGWQRFLHDPGPVVVGATQEAGCFGAAYEFLFNLSHQLKKAGLRGKVPLTYVTAEPFLGHFGIGGLPGGEKLLGMFLKKEGIQAVTDTAMTEVSPGKLVLTDGRVLDFAYAMIVPPFLGQQVVQSVEGLADDKGYVPVHDTYQSVAYANVYAVGRHGALDHRGVGRRAQDRLPHRGPSVPLRRS